MIVISPVNVGDNQAGKEDKAYPYFGPELKIQREIVRFRYLPERLPRGIL